MTIAERLRKRAASTAMTAGGIAMAGAIGCAGLAPPASAAPAAAAPAAATSKLTLKFRLAPMPQGQLVVNGGELSLQGYGFTPGSSHEVAVSFLGIQVPVGTVTAGPGGSASWSDSLSATAAALRRAQARTAGYPVTLSPPITLVILNAGQGTAVIARAPAITRLGRHPVRAVEPGYGIIKPGSATLVYDQAAATISVTVNATGLAPGSHAAHIHVGSCQRQGGVASVLADFTANARGVISNETRTVAGVKAVELSGGWYLNLHQGNSGNILTSGGQPTINFRPLECANI